jgi:hypothetical protein
MLSPQAALIFAMVVALGTERAIAQEDIDVVGDLVDHLPIFCGLDRRQTGELAARCSAQIARPGGMDQAYGQIRDALSGRLREAAYALSCDVIALRRPQQGQKALERIRAQLELDAATARTVEGAARERRKDLGGTAFARPAQRQASTSAWLNVPLPS